MVAAEAQACGTPVVAFRRGALDEVILDGVTGFLVAPDDIAAAAEAVTQDGRALALGMPRACRTATSTWSSVSTRTNGSTGESPMLAWRRQSMADTGHWLAGRVALVTGASRGIGAATAEAIAAAGAHVVLAARDRDGSRRRRQTHP